MGARAWRRFLSRAVCFNCGWRRTSRGTHPRDHNFVVMYARRHAETWGHEVEVGQEKFITYRGAPRPLTVRRARLLGRLMAEEAICEL